MFAGFVTISLPLLKSWSKSPYVLLLVVLTLPPPAGVAHTKSVPPEFTDRTWFAVPLANLVNLVPSDFRVSPTAVDVSVTVLLERLIFLLVKVWPNASTATVSPAVRRGHVIILSAKIAEPVRI